MEIQTSCFQAWSFVFLTFLSYDVNEECKSDSSAKTMQDQDGCHPSTSVVPHTRDADDDEGGFDQTQKRPKT